MVESKTLGNCSYNDIIFLKSILNFERKAIQYVLNKTHLCIKHNFLHKIKSCTRILRM